MKKILAINIFIFLAGTLSVNSQTIASREDAFKTILGEEAIVRTVTLQSDEYPFICRRKYNSNSHSFILHRRNDPANSSIVFACPQYNNGGEIKINDMVIIDRICYFCGSQSDAQNGTKGIVGRIDLNQADFSSPSIKFNFLSLSSVKEFLRIDGTRSSLGDCLALVGSSNNPTTPSCAAFVLWHGTLWDYKICGLNDSDETLTDIVFTKNGEKVVSVSRIDGKPYWFCLRGEWTDTAFNMLSNTLTDYCQRNTIKTYGLTLPSSSNPHPTWHYNDVDLRLVANLDKDEEVTVAYECFDDTRICDPQIVAMFKIDLSGFPLNLAMNVIGQQAVFGYFNQPNTLADIKYILSDKTIGLLHRCGVCQDEISTVLQFPSWGYVGYLEALQVGPQEHFSLDVYNHSLVYLAGIDPSDNRLLFFQQEKTELNHSCYFTRPMARSETLKETCGLEYGRRDVSLDINRDLQSTQTPQLGNFTYYDETCQKIIP